MLESVAVATTVLPCTTYDKNSDSLRQLKRQLVKVVVIKSYPNIFNEKSEAKKINSISDLTEYYKVSDRRGLRAPL